MFKIKICGITNVNDYKTIIDMGANYAGFVFYKKSSRYIDAEKAKKIIEECRNQANANEEVD